MRAPRGLVLVSLLGMLTIVGVHVWVIPDRSGNPISRVPRQQVSVVHVSPTLHNVAITRKFNLQPPGPQQTQPPQPLRPALLRRVVLTAGWPIVREAWDPPVEPGQLPRGIIPPQRTFEWLCLSAADDQQQGQQNGQSCRQPPSVPALVPCDTGLTISYVGCFSNGEGEQRARAGKHENGEHAPLQFQFQFQFQFSSSRYCMPVFNSLRILSEPLQ
jgi:hypothetical protein